MNLRPVRKQSPELNLTPLIDVVFLLLIFFMVSTTFQKDAAIEVELPGVSPETSSPQEEPVKSIELTVDRDGNYFVNEKALVNNSMDNLVRAIEREAGERRDMPFIINADADASHQSVIRVMDAAGSSGFQKITFSAKRTFEQ